MTPVLLRDWLLAELRCVAQPLDLDALVAQGKLAPVRRNGRILKTKYRVLVNLRELPAEVLERVEVFGEEDGGQAILTLPPRRGSL